MKALKVIGKLLVALVAIAGAGAAVYLLIQRYVGDKKAATYYDDEDFFECDCDGCDVVECAAQDVKEVTAEVKEAVAEKIEDAAAAVEDKAKDVKKAAKKAQK